MIDIYVFIVNWTAFCCVFCSMLPLEFQLIWIVFLSQLDASLNSFCQPFFKFTTQHVLNTTVHNVKSAECPLVYMSVAITLFYLLCPSHLQYSHKELLSMPPSSIHPSILSSIRDLGTGHQLPKICSHRAGQPKQRKISVLHSPRDRT